MEIRVIFLHRENLPQTSNIFRNVSGTHEMSISDAYKYNPYYNSINK
jgi:hypothetical protein